MAKKADLSNLIIPKKKVGTVKKSPTHIEEKAVSKIHKKETPTKTKAKVPIKPATIDFAKPLWVKLKTKALERGITFKSLVSEYCEAGLKADS